MAAPVTLNWLGQAGFLMRGPSGSVAFDPYLSDQCLREHGLARLMAAPITAAELGADVVLISHWHADHLDLDSVADLASSGSTIVAPASCISRIAGRGVPTDRLIEIATGQTRRLGAIIVTATPARHEVPGAITEDAVGYVVELDGARVYHSGDTDYDRTLLAASAAGVLDAAMICINGTGGNMNTWEAATLAAQLRPRLAIPMHWGMWSAAGYGPEATLDPTEFATILGRLSDGAEVAIPLIGSPIELPLALATLTT